MKKYVVSIEDLDDTQSAKVLHNVTKTELSKLIDIGVGRSGYCVNVLREEEQSNFDYYYEKALEINKAKFFVSGLGHFDINVEEFARILQASFEGTEKPEDIYHELHDKLFGE